MKKLLAPLLILILHSTLFSQSYFTFNDKYIKKFNDAEVIYLFKDQAKKIYKTSNDSTFTIEGLVKLYWPKKEIKYYENFADIKNDPKASKHWYVGFTYRMVKTTSTFTNANTTYKTAHYHGASNRLAIGAGKFGYTLAGPFMKDSPFPAERILYGFNHLKRVTNISISENDKFKRFYYLRSDNKKFLENDTLIICEEDLTPKMQGKFDFSKVYEGKIKVVNRTMWLDYFKDRKLGYLIVERSSNSAGTAFVSIYHTTEKDVIYASGPWFALGERKYLDYLIDKVFFKKQFR